MMSKFLDYRVIVVKPADVLIISNVGEAASLSVSQAAIDSLREDMGCTAVYLFAGDVNYDILRRSDADAPPALGRVADDE